MICTWPDRSPAKIANMARRFIDLDSSADWEASRQDRRATRDGERGTIGDLCSESSQKCSAETPLQRRRIVEFWTPLTSTWSRNRLFDVDLMSCRLGSGGPGLDLLCLQVAGGLSLSPSPMQTARCQDRGGQTPTFEKKKGKGSRVSSTALSGAF